MSPTTHAAALLELLTQIPDESAKPNVPPVEVWDRPAALRLLESAIREAARQEQERVAAIVENFAALNDAEDGPRYPGLADWEGGDDAGRWVLNRDKLVELIRSRP